MPFAGWGSVYGAAGSGKTLGAVAGMAADGIVIGYPTSLQGLERWGMVPTPYERGAVRPPNGVWFIDLEAASHNPLYEGQNVLEITLRLLRGLPARGFRKILVDDFGFTLHTAAAQLVRANVKGWNTWNAVKERLVDMNRPDSLAVIGGRAVMADSGYLAVLTVHTRAPKLDDDGSVLREGDAAIPGYDISELWGGLGTFHGQIRKPEAPPLGWPFVVDFQGDGVFRRKVRAWLPFKQAPWHLGAILRATNDPMITCYEHHLQWVPEARTLLEGQLRAMGFPANRDAGALRAALGAVSAHLGGDLGKVRFVWEEVLPYLQITSVDPLDAMLEGVVGGPEPKAATPES